MKTQKINFANKNGLILTGLLDTPDSGSINAYALFAHCFTCTKDIKAAYNISKTMSIAGIAVLRFDFTGLGGSEGEFEHTNFTSNVDDLIAAADYLNENHQAPKILLGHSLGGTAVLQAAQHMSSVVAVATIASPSSPKHLAEILTKNNAQIEAKGEACITLGDNTYKITGQFLHNLEQTQMTKTIQHLNRALLILHSPHDKTVHVDNAAEIFQIARHPKSFVSLDKADHILSNPADAQYAGSLIATWAAKYLDFNQDTHKQSYTDDDYHTAVAQIAQNKYATTLRIRNHHLLADEPESLGGNDIGPSPYEYLLAALGSCTAITLRMYADRKSWPLQAISVKLKHKKTRLPTNENTEKPQKSIDYIERAIDFSGELSDEQRSRLLEIANKCPVHSTLQAKIHIETKIMV